MAMQTDFTVILDDRPGTAALVGETMGRAQLNIDGLSLFTSGGVAILHVLVSPDEEERAREAMMAARIDLHGERPVWVAQLVDRPGEMGRLLRVLSDADVNCDLLYLDARGRLVIGAEDMGEVSHLLS
jgi:hypothetical protein